MNRRSFFGFIAASLAATAVTTASAVRPPSDTTYFKPMTRRSVDEKWGRLTNDQFARINSAFVNVPEANRYPECFAWQNVETGEMTPATKAMPFLPRTRLVRISDVAEQ